MDSTLRQDVIIPGHFEDAPTNGGFLRFSTTSLLLVTAAILWAIRRFAMQRHRMEGEPPILPGLPFFGSARQFQHDSIGLIHSSAEKYGPVFTLKLPFNYLHIVADVHAVEAFVKHRDFNFDPIQRWVNRNVFGFRVPNASGIIREAALSSKAAMLGRSMEQYNDYLAEYYKEIGSRADDWQRCSLQQVMNDTMFRAIFNTVFGKSDDHPFNYRSLRKRFDIFHEAFLFLWLGFPLWLFPKAKAAITAVKDSHPTFEELMDRKDSCEYLRKALGMLIEAGGTMHEVMGHNLVYMHVNYNTVKTTFWALCRLIENNEALTALRDETNAFLIGRTKEHDDTVEVPLSEVERLPTLDSIVKETFRLYSGVIMIRIVANDTTLELRDGRQYRFKKGDKVAVYPPAIHMDPDIYEEPKMFRYDRFIGATFYKGGERVRHNLLPYGTKCPGQRLSILNMKVFILTFFAYFDVCSESPIPAIDSKQYGQEILPPIGDMEIQLRRRKDAVVLRTVGDY